jgi:hypothetical protein
MRGTGTDQDGEGHGDRDDRVAAKEGVGDDGSGHRGQADAAGDDVGDLGRVDARHVVLLDQVDDQVAQGAARGHTKPHHGDCTIPYTHVTFFSLQSSDDEDRERERPPRKGKVIHPPFLFGSLCGCCRDS